MTSDKALGRDVRDAVAVCWDCDSIAKWKQAIHAKHGKDDCDCDKRAIWVEGYSPSPSRT
jgi:hypothetical protein